MEKVLVLGASGTVGRRLVERLRSDGQPLRAAHRNPRPSADVETARFDWDDPGTWPQALDSVDSAFVVAPSFRADPADRIAGFVERAIEHGVQRLVLLSALGVDDAPPDSGYSRMQRVVREAPIVSVVLQPGWFAQDLTEKFMAPQNGEVAIPAGDARIAWTDAADIAGVAAVALTASHQAATTLRITGPVAVDMHQTADLLTEAHGERVVYRDADPAEYRDGLVLAGVPSDYADVLSGLFAAMRAGAASVTTTTVEDVLGRPARDLAAVLRREVGAAPVR